MKELVAKHVSEAIEAAKRRGHSVAAIAKACGISRAAVYQWASGESKSIDGFNLVELAELSGYNARWIIKGKGPKESRLSDDEELLLRAFNLSEPAIREMFLVMARSEIEKSGAKAKVA